MLIAQSSKSVLDSAGRTGVQIQVIAEKMMSYYPDNQYEDDDNDDYDEEDDDEEEEDFEINPQLTNLSADLKRLLGLPADELQTDWKPPERPGMDNSAPIVATGKNVALQPAAVPTPMAMKQTGGGGGMGGGRVQSTPAQPIVMESRFQPQAPPSAQRPSNNGRIMMSATPGPIMTPAVSDGVVRPSSQPAMKRSNSKETGIDRLLSLSAEIRNTMNVMKTDPPVARQTTNEYKTYSYNLANADEGEDEGEDDDEDEDEDEGSFRSLETTPMSAELRRLLGLPAVANENNANVTNVVPVSDWKPPQSSGLSNSDPIIKTGKNIRPTAPSPVSVSFAPSVTSSNVSQLDEDEDDDDDEEDDEDDDEGRSFDDVPMSADLRRLLGLAPLAETANTDWKPPQRSGLDNSDPIIKSQGSAVKQNQMDEDDDDNDYDETEEEDDNLGSLEDVAMSDDLRRILGLPVLNENQKGISSNTNWKAPTSSGLANSEPIIRTSKNAAPVSYGDGGNDDDDGDEEEFDEDDEDDSADQEIEMSDNLKRALGLLPQDSRPTVQTDWKPPSRPGLDNSTPLVQMNGR
jgi:hypothetical protein